MRYALERTADPEIEPVTIAEMLQHVREFTSASAATQAELTALITAGREWVEEATGRALVDQTWRLTLIGNSGVNAGGDTVGGFRGPGPVAGNSTYSAGTWSWGRIGELMLPKSPVLAITSFTSVDSAGTETTIDPATYELREAAGKWPRLVALSGATWSAWIAGDMRATFRAGFADRTGSPQTGAEVVPERFKQAIKLWVEANYDRDERMMPLLLETAARLVGGEKADLPFA